MAEVTSEPEESAMWKSSVLVVANLTADSDELRETLRARAARGPAVFTLLVPMHGAGPEARAAAQAQLDTTLQVLAEEGLDVRGVVGDCDPVAAVGDVWDPCSFDEVVVSTLPSGSSRWLALDLPHRIGRLTGVPVLHVVPRTRRQSAGGPPPRHDRSPLGPLAVLGWGHHG